MAKANRHPDRAECMGYLAEYHTPAHVIGHCKAVAAAAYTMGKAMNEAGDQLDLDLILAAGLLHDMARVEDNHWDVAADFCLRHGFRQEAEIIRVHMRYEGFTDAFHLTETDLVCLADRVVLEDRYAGIDRRIDYIIDKAVRNGHPEHRPIILRKKEETKKLIRSMEARIGCSLDALMADIDYEQVEHA